MSRAGPAASAASRAPGAAPKVSGKQQPSPCPGRSLAPGEAPPSHSRRLNSSAAPGEARFLQVMPRSPGCCHRPVASASLSLPAQPGLGRAGPGLGEKEPRCPGAGSSGPEPIGRQRVATGTLRSAWRSGSGKEARPLQVLTCSLPSLLSSGAEGARGSFRAPLHCGSASAAQGGLLA